MIDTTGPRRRNVLLVGFGLVLGVGACLHGTSPAPDPAEIARCETCHAEQVRFWRHGGHRTLGCDVCHGPPGNHVRKEIDPRPKLLIRGPEQCLRCHLRRKGEPEEPPRIDGLEAHLAAIEKKHVTTIDRKRVGDRCNFCHEPHALE
jgi:hypothetical protein